MLTGNKRTASTLAGAPTKRRRTHDVGKPVRTARFLRASTVAEAWARRTVCGGRWFDAGTSIVAAFADQGHKVFDVEASSPNLLVDNDGHNWCLWDDEELTAEEEEQLAARREERTRRGVPPCGVTRVHAAARFAGGDNSNARVVVTPPGGRASWSVSFDIRRDDDVPLTVTVRVPEGRKLCSWTSHHVEPVWLGRLGRWSTPVLDMARFVPVAGAQSTVCAHHADRHTVLKPTYTMTARRESETITVSRTDGHTMELRACQWGTGWVHMRANSSQGRWPDHVVIEFHFQDVTGPTVCALLGDAL